MAQQFLEMPDKDGYFGEYGGQIVSPELKAVMDEIATAYEEVSKTKAFQDELQELLRKLRERADQCRPPVSPPSVRMA